jgi:hypothetical protein
MQFMVFVPASIIVDIIRLAGVPHSVHGRGWLVFLQLLEMAAKVSVLLLGLDNFSVLYTLVFCLRLELRPAIAWDALLDLKSDLASDHRSSRASHVMAGCNSRGQVLHSADMCQMGRARSVRVQLAEAPQM